MPFDALAQFEGQRFAVFAVAPALGQIGHDRGEAVLRHMLIEHDQIVEHPHHRAQRGDRRFLVDRHRGRAGDERDPQDPAVLLGSGRHGAESGDQQRGDEACKMAAHELSSTLLRWWSRSVLIGHLSSQTSSIRHPLNRLLTIIVKPLTRGSQQLAARV